MVVGGIGHDHNQDDDDTGRLRRRHREEEDVVVVENNLLRQRIAIQNSLIKELETKLALTKSQQALAKLEDMLHNDLRTLRTRPQGPTTTQQQPRRRATTQYYSHDDNAYDDDDDDSSVDSNDATNRHSNSVDYHDVDDDDVDSDVSYSTCSVTAQESTSSSSDEHGFKSTLFQQEWTTRFPQTNTNNISIWNQLI